MRAPRFLRLHSRWREQVDAYVDGELVIGEARNLERHLAGCQQCSVRVGQARAMKALLSEIPQAPAPRSFRLTPEMVSEPLRPRSAPAKPATTAFRVAQFATGFAVVALVAVAVVDVGRSSNGSGSNSAASSARESAADQSAPLGDAAGAISAATAPGQPAATPSPSPAFVPPNTGGVVASGFATPTLATTAPGAFAATPSDAPDALSENASKSAGGTAAPQPLAERASESNDGRGFRPVELALTAVVVAGAAATLGLYLRRRRA